VKLKKLSKRESTSGADTLPPEIETGAPDIETGVRPMTRLHAPEDPVRASWHTGRPAEEERVSSVVERAPRPPSTILPLDEGIDSEQATTLVIMEAGASWPGWVKELQRRAPNSMVEVQPSSEQAEGFAARVRRRVTSLRQRGVALVGAVYAAASPASDEERSVRRELCRVLLDALMPSGELVLSGAGWGTWGVDARSREDLMGLAGDLSCRLKGSAQTVSVRFSDPTEESGVHKAPSFPASVRGARESA
jgi:hypothetical protein